MTGFQWSDGGDGFLVIGDKKLEYQSWGPSPEQAPTLIMLHEGLGCVELWRDFPQKLASETGFGVFVYSRAGHGKSDSCELPRPVDYMSVEAEQILPQVLDQIGFQRGVLLGHSDGASIASIYTGFRQDHRVRGLILIAPHFFTEDTGLEEIAQIRDEYETTDLRARMGKYHRDPDNAFRGWNDAWLDPEFKEWNIADAIDYFRIPVLAIQGTNDPYGTLAQIEEIEQRIYSPLDTEIIDGCEHAPHIEEPARTLSSIASYLERLQQIEAGKPLVA